MVGPDYYRRNALEARTCLSIIRDVSPVITTAIDGGHTTRAGRVAGSFRSIGREELADSMLSMMRQVGYVVKEENPFEEDVRVDIIETSPYAARIKLMWQKMRPAVISCLASAGIVQKPQDVTSGLASSKLRTLSATGHTKCISAIPCMFRSIRTLSWMR